MEQTGNLKLPLILPSQAQKHVTHNEALRALDELVQLSVESRVLSAPPQAAVGARYIVAGPASDAWTGKEGHIAVAEPGGWFFHVPLPGWHCFVADEGRFVHWTGAGWTDSSSATAGEFERIGLATQATPSVPFSARLNSALFTARELADGGSGDVRLALNREGAGQTASVIFQSGYEGRAEFGLTGEDSFDLKVSADGQAWRTALAIDPETGAVDAPTGLRYAGYWRFFASTDLIVTGAPTAPLVFDTTSHNPGLAYNPATGAFTAPEDGLYLVVLSFNTSGAAPFTVDAEINGTPTTRVQFSPNGFSHLSKTFTCAMTAGDQLTFVVKENSSARFDGGGLFDNVVVLRLGLL